MKRKQIKTNFKTKTDQLSREIGAARVSCDFGFICVYILNSYKTSEMIGFICEIKTMELTMTKA